MSDKYRYHCPVTAAEKRNAQLQVVEESSKGAVNLVDSTVSPPQEKRSGSDRRRREDEQTDRHSRSWDWVSWKSSARRTSMYRAVASRSHTSWVTEGNGRK